MAGVDRRQFLRALVTGVGGASAVALVGCAASEPVEYVPSDEGVTPAVKVSVIDNRYEPAEVEIRAGEAVEWQFRGAMKHDVVAEDGEFISELLPNGSTYTHVFEAAGEFPYICSIHPEMTGVVRVV